MPDSSNAEKTPGSGEARVTLDVAFKIAREHVNARRLTKAIDIYQTIAREAPLQAANTAVSALVALLMRSNREAEAQRAFASFLTRQFIHIDAKKSKSRILLTFGLQSWDRIVFINAGKGVSFSINAGHFDIAALLKTDQIGIDRAFVPVSIGPGALPEMQARLREYPAILNVVADPIAEASTLQNISTLLAKFDGKVLNRATAVAETTRENVATLLVDIPGIVTPRVSTAETLNASVLKERFAASLNGLIVRPVNSQTGIGVRLIRKLDDIATAASELQGQHVYMTAYHDFRDSKSGRYVKMRFFKVGDDLFPEHRIVADVWNIHSADRHRIMRDNPDLQSAEQRFLENPAGTIGSDAMNALSKALNRFNLDYVGFDFAQLPDGRVLLFEANPAMRLNYDHCAAFPYLRPHLDRISQAFTRMVESAVSPH